MTDELCGLCKTALATIRVSTLGVPPFVACERCFCAYNEGFHRGRVWQSTYRRTVSEDRKRHGRQARQTH